MVLPFHHIPAHKIHWFFTLKSIVIHIAGFAITGWMIQSVGVDTIFIDSNQYTNLRLSWRFLSGINSMIKNYATMDVIVNDFYRYSKKQRSPLIQLIVIPLFGIISSNESCVLYGKALWDPLLIVDHWTSKGGRAAAFFRALAFLIANIAINISPNSISVAVGLSTLLFQYFDIRRAQYVCAVLRAWALTP
jgi:NCS1 family nucleobase:cation symporter-1